MNSVDELSALVDKVLNDEADWDETLTLLSSCIDSEPGSAPLLELRLRMFEAAHDRVAITRDLRNLSELKPDDVDLALRMLRNQWTWSHAIAESEFADAYNAAGGDQFETADEAKIEAIQASPAYQAVGIRANTRSDELRHETIKQFVELMRKHAADIDATKKILHASNHTVYWKPWHQFTMLLIALQVHPEDVELKKQEALYFASLSELVEDGVEKTPIGYFYDAAAGRIHARTAYEALDMIEALPDFDSDRDLLVAYARLQRTLGNYEGAAQSFTSLARACEVALSQTTEAERELIQDQMNDALREAEECRGGREEVFRGYFDSLSSAINRARDKMLEWSEKLQKFSGAEDAASSARQPPDWKEASSSLESWRNASMNQQPEPTDEEKVTLREKAAKIAESTMKLIRSKKIVLGPMSQSDFIATLPEWFTEIAPYLRNEGMNFVGWYQNLASVEALGHEAPGQLWTSPRHDFALTAEAGAKVRLKRCLTEFSDGSIMITADTRGNSYWSSGPKVRSFNVFKSTPIEEMLSLHQVRVRAALARTPGLRVVPLDCLERVENFEKLLSNLSREFRIANGITEPEIRGMNVKHHAYYASELKREVMERIATLDN